MQEFGEKVIGAPYIERPGAYAVIRNENGEFALLEVHGRYFLPGGGIDAGETAEQTVTRESQEEMGADITLGRHIGTAAEYLYSENKDKYFHIIGTFFEATLNGLARGGSEADHQLVWRSIGDATAKMARGSQLWALEQVLH